MCKDISSGCKFENLLIEREFSFKSPLNEQLLPEWTIMVGRHRHRWARAVMVIQTAKDSRDDRIWTNLANFQLDRS